MSKSFLLLASALCLLGQVCGSVSSFRVEHSLDGGATYRERSSFHLNDKGEVSFASESTNSISQQEVEAFKSLLATNSMYMLRIQPQTDSRSVEAVYAAIPAVCDSFRRHIIM